jgi:hypothetical protein
MGDQHNPINGTLARHVNLVYDPGTDTWSERTPTPGTFGNDRPVASKVLLDGRPRIQLLRAWTNLQYIP